MYRNLNNSKTNLTLATTYSLFIENINSALNNDISRKLANASLFYIEINSLIL